MDARDLVLDALQTLEIDQAALAKRLGRSQATVSRWISGATAPDYESCLRLAKIIGRPPREVLRAAGLDPLLVPDEGAPAEVDIRRQVRRDQLDSWMDAVGPENEQAFWDYLNAHGETGVILIHRTRTAINAEGEGAANAAVNARTDRARARRKSSGPPLNDRQHAPRGLPAGHRRVTNSAVAA